MAILGERKTKKYSFMLWGQNMNDIFQVEELDLPEDKCEMDKNYDFHGCVRRSISRQVGICKWNKVVISPRWGVGLSGMYGVRQIWL